jgi:hypothetical protein
VSVVGAVFTQVLPVVAGRDEGLSAALIAGTLAVAVVMGVAVDVSVQAACRS